MPRKKKEEQELETTAEVSEETVEQETAVEAQTEETETVEAKTEEIVAPKVSAKRKKADKSEAKKTVSEDSKKQSKRAERIGIVSSDKMTKTVVVRVDRLIKHPIYRKYVRRKKNFMAHDELGATIGDKVRIIETRPLSARKRWRVVEIIQKAEK
jgi:small subunit ribosomal protein S17